MTHNSASVAFLATGDELIQGDLLNTNAHTMIQALQESGIAPGQQLIVGDQQQAIKESIAYLLDRHAALIIIGGLGPTCDDLTRFALADYLNTPLSFDQSSWEHIQQRFAKYLKHLLT